MFFSIITSISAFVLMILFLFWGNTYIPETKNAIMFFLNTILPTMFPFYVLSSIIVSSSSINILTRPLKCVTRLYNLPPQAACAIFLGIICGFPIGAKITCDLLKNNYITQKEAAILASFTNNASPIFIISIVGGIYFKDKLHGLLIWLCIVLSSLLTGLILSKIYLDKLNSFNNTHTNNISNKTTIADSITSALNTSLYVGAVIIFFSSITALIKEIPLINQKIYIVLYSFLEMTGGLNSLFFNNTHELNLYKYLYTVAIISWSGLCVHMQIYGILKSSGIKIKYFFIGKILQTIISIIIYIVFSKFFIK